MFLVQISSNSFIDAERIDWIGLVDGKIACTMISDGDSPVVVNDDYRDIFLNHVQALNGNMINIEAHFKSIIQSV